MITFLLILFFSIICSQEGGRIFSLPQFKPPEFPNLPAHLSIVRGEIIWTDTVIYAVYKSIVDSYKKNGISGFRVQIYGKTGKEAYKEAQANKISFLQTYPDIPVYTIFNPPDFKVQVGNFLFKLDAYIFLQQIKYSFPYSIIVPCNVVKE